MNTLADTIIAHLQRAGVRRLFGMPGGGSNADLVEAAGRAGLPFTLAHTETAGAFMASAQAELTGRPGACIATLGPGAASVVNGVANALLDRIPLLVLTDCYDEAAAQVMQHQVLRHAELFAPVTLWSARLRPTGLAETMQRAVSVALGPPAGPVHLDCGPDVTGTLALDASAMSTASGTLALDASAASAASGTLTASDIPAASDTPVAPPASDIPAAFAASAASNLLAASATTAASGMPARPLASVAAAPATPGAPPASVAANMPASSRTGVSDRPATSAASGMSAAPLAGAPSGSVPVPLPELSLTPAAELALRKARRPLFLVGLGARTPAIATALRALCEQHGIPALVTYKAKGVVPDRHPWFGGVLTHGALERPVLEQADLFIAVGLDPVELLPRAWAYPQPVISLSAWQLAQSHIPLTADLVGDVAGGLNALAAWLPAATNWDQAWLHAAVESQRAVMRGGESSHGLLPYQVVELAAQAYPGARVTVDAGAHMFPALSLWPAQEPCGLLISNGLATMGFALPAAIGAALLDRSRPTLVFTGDGGLLMCAAELRTSARERLPLRILVFDDNTLSLIRIKQAQRGYRPDGVTFGAIDWPALGNALGVHTLPAADAQSLENALRDTINVAGPVLIAARVDPEPYLGIMRALRG